MKTEWELFVTYGLTPFTLKATLEYESAQIMRIRVHGKNSILLETDFPAHRATRSKKGLQWKIKEGKMDAGNPKNARLLIDIIRELELALKEDYPKYY